MLAELLKLMTAIQKKKKEKKKEKEKKP